MPPRKTSFGIWNQRMQRSKTEQSQKGFKKKKRIFGIFQIRNFETSYARECLQKKKKMMMMMEMPAI